VQSISFPKPGKAILGVMIAVLAIWVALAAGINWARIDPEIVAPFVGNTEKVLSFQLWRFVTAPLIHLWSGDGAVSHIVMTLLGLYFLGPTLEDRWGPRKTLTFLFGAAAFAFVCQVLVGLVVPQLRQPIWYGGLGMVDAVAVAWALQAREGSQVRLMFVLPVSPMMLVGFIFMMNVLTVIAIGSKVEGLVTPFGGMAAGYLFGDRSPLRRTWLKFKLKRIQAETAAMQGRRRAAAAGFRVIRGGTDEPPKDKRYLN
jgi:membrane associated rhomboid family serine protease